MTWKSVALEEVLELADPGVWGSKAAENGVRVIRSTNFRDDGSLDLSTPALRSVPSSKRCQKTLARGDIILERSGGSPTQPVGRVCYFEGAEEPHLFGNFCQRLRSNQKLLDPRFLFWHLYHLHRSGGTLAHQKQTTGIRNLDFQAYLRHPVPIPRLSEQRRIAGILDRVAHLRQLRSEADSKADRTLIALFAKMFSHADSAGPEQRFDRLVQVGGPFVEPNQHEYLDLPHVGGQQIEKNTGRILSTRSVRDSQLRSGKFLFTEEHVLYSKIRPYLNKVAYPRFSGLCSADIYPLLPRDRRIGPWFLTALLRSEAFRTYAKGQSERLRIPKLNRAQLGSYGVRVPHPRALAAFESRAEELALTEERRLQSRTRIDSLFKLVLHRSFLDEVTAPSREAEAPEPLLHALAVARTE